MGKPLLSLIRSSGSFGTILLVCAAIAAPGPSVAASDLYSAEVSVAASGVDARRDAYREALRVVLSRVAGAGLDAGRIDALFPNATNYVVQFQPVNREMLRVSFDGDAIERTLTQAGETFWGDDRPPTLVWVAVDWGNGDRELLASSDAVDEPAALGSAPSRDQILRNQILDVAERRGIPVLFPLLDTDDLREVNFADVWGGFDEAVVQASERYAVDSILIGRVRGDRLSSARWTHRFGGESMTIAGAPELALASVADRLASVFAIGGRDTLRDVRLTVAGITTMEAYGYLVKLLDGINVVEQHAIRSVNGDRIEFAVSVHGGAQRLARALTVKGLVPEERQTTRPDFGRPDDAAVQTIPVIPSDALFFFLDR
jgi:hypothetical protein